MLWLGMGISSAINAAWLVGISLQVLLAFVLLRRRAWKEFPIFTAYVIATLLESCIAYCVTHYPGVYFYVYTVGEGISLLLAVALAFEIFDRLVSAHAALRHVGLLVLRVAMILLVVLAVVVIFAQRPIGKNGIVTALLIVEEAARVIEIGLIMFLFVCSSAFGLHWRQHEFGMAMGLGVFTAVKLIALALIPHTVATAGSLNFVMTLSFDISVLIWLGYLLAPERVTSESELPKRAQLEQWNQAITELIHQ